MTAPAHVVAALALEAEVDNARLAKAIRNFTDSDGDDDGGMMDNIMEFHGMTSGKQIGPRAKKPRGRGLGKATLILRGAILSTFDVTDKPVTVRQMFYLVSVRGAVKKDENGYSQVQQQLLKMRREGIIPYGWIADHTRWMRKPETFDSVEDALQNTARFYRRAVWKDLPVRVEVWCEKATLAGVLYDVTSVYDVPLYPTGGDSSETFVYHAAEQTKASGKRGIIYYVGDFDPGGWNMSSNLEKKLRGFGADIELVRLAVNHDQITSMNLSTRETKGNDTKAKKFFDLFGEGQRSAEVEALPPDTLRDIVREAIEQHIPAGHLEHLEVVEESERSLLERLEKIAAGEKH